MPIVVIEYSDSTVPTGFVNLDVAVQATKLAKRMELQISYNTSDFQDCHIGHQLNIRRAG